MGLMSRATRTLVALGRMKGGGPEAAPKRGSAVADQAAGVPRGDLVSQTISAPRTWRTAAECVSRRPARAKPATGAACIPMIHRLPVRCDRAAT